MKHRFPMSVALVLVCASATAGWAFFKPTKSGTEITLAAQALIASLDAKQQKQALLAYDTPVRFDWHFIPKAERKGLQLKEMTAEQKQAAFALLQSAVSKMGYNKATKIMALESLLHALEQGKGANIRDPQRYYFTFFGKPAADSKWGLSVEGHHLSLNFVLEQNELISTTPQFFAPNPAEVKQDYEGLAKQGLRVLEKEETLAFELVQSLSAEQAKAAITAEKAPKEIRAAGEAQPPQTAPIGIAASKLNEEQQKLLRGLVEEYARAAVYEVATQRLMTIEGNGWENVHFAWEGATKPGVGHYYRIQGKSFLIELVNTQPDAAGNPANHIHSVWRDMAGDFAVPIKTE